MTLSELITALSQIATDHPALAHAPVLYRPAQPLANGDYAQVTAAQLEDNIDPDVAPYITLDGPWGSQ